MIEKKWKRFEALVAKVQADLAPDATIKLNQKLIGHITKTKREIDILVESKVGNYDIKIAIDCKDYKKPVDVKEVESIIGLMRDISVNLGVIVSASGFTESALKAGKEAGLRLYRLIDTDDHDWKSVVSFPALCYVKNLDYYDLIFSYFGNLPIYPCSNPNEEIIYSTNQKKLGKVGKLLVQWWETNNENFEYGYHENIKFLGNEIFIKSKNDFIKIDVKANLKIDQKIFFRNWPVTQIAGFEDQYEKGKISTRGFTLNNFNLTGLKNNWQEVPDITKFALEPFIKMSIITHCEI